MPEPNLAKEYLDILVLRVAKSVIKACAGYSLTGVYSEVTDLLGRLWTLQRLKKNEC